MEQVTADGIERVAYRLTYDTCHFDELKQAVHARNEYSNNEVVDSACQYARFTGVHTPNAFIAFACLMSSSPFQVK